MAMYQSNEADGTEDGRGERIAGYVSEKPRLVTRILAQMREVHLPDALQAEDLQRPEHSSGFLSVGP
eukprot:1753047-Lingulodinium_polyedra.AAC.1